jgi:hypothetical protein
MFVSLEAFRVGDSLFTDLLRASATVGSVSISRPSSSFKSRDELCEERSLGSKLTCWKPGGIVGDGIGIDPADRSDLVRAKGLEDALELGRCLKISWKRVDLRSALGVTLAGALRRAILLSSAAASSILRVLNDDPSGAGKVGQLCVRGGMFVVAID